MVEEELHQIEEEEACQEEEDETTYVEMVDEEECGNPESSGPRMEADTKDNPPLASSGDTVSPEEEAILLGGTPYLRIWQLDLTAPGARPPWSQEGWPSYVSHP